jgi:hypothetical protein
MAETRIGLRAVLLSAGACLLGMLGGCGDSSSAASESSNGQTAVATAEGHAEGDQNALAARKKLLRKTVGELEDRNRVCKIMSDRFLRDNYDGAGEAGRRRCEKAVHSHQKKDGQRLRSYRIPTFGLKKATVRIVESSGTRVLIAFVFLEDRWLMDSARSPDSEG